MIRVIGFCTGSLLAVAALFFLVGVPRIERDDRAEEQARIDAVIENLQRKWDEHGSAGQAATAGPEGELPQPASLDDTVAVQPPAFPTATDALAGNGNPVQRPADWTTEPEWQAIWAPFRTEIAAQGFVGRLESVTGLDYRVAKIRAGQYQVTFAYRDEAELREGLARIATVTGLDVSAERP